MVFLLQTRRLDIRPLVPGDLDDLAALYGDREVVRHLADGIPLTREETALLLIEAIEGHDDDDPGLLACVERLTGSFVGRCGFREWQVDGVSHLEIGWMVAPRHQRQGLGTEQGTALRDHAFATTDRDDLIAVIQPANAASIRVAQKIGGRKWRDWVTPNGHDVVLYRFERS